MIKGLHHNAYRCRDSEETRTFYEDFLELTQPTLSPSWKLRPGEKPMPCTAFIDWAIIPS